eukprot:GFUD01107221.1.p1 GENE.GFUD01107221.1~~GFUD01107221.1.p1  ORF type:complete len:102 (-),score=16.75 GFUD01107221.1:147-452(-)
MLMKQSQVKLLCCVIIICFCLSILAVFHVITSKCNTGNTNTTDCSCQGDQSHKHVDTPTNETSDHKLCIIVPIRDRFEELLEFAPYIKTFLNNQAAISLHQ